MRDTLGFLVKKHTIYQIDKSYHSQVLFYDRARNNLRATNDVKASQIISSGNNNTSLGVRSNKSGELVSSNPQSSHSNIECHHCHGRSHSFL